MTTSLPLLWTLIGSPGNSCFSWSTSSAQVALDDDLVALDAAGLVPHEHRDRAGRLAVHQQLAAAWSPSRRRRSGLVSETRVMRRADVQQRGASDEQLHRRCPSADAPALAAGVSALRATGACSADLRVNGVPRSQGDGHEDRGGAQLGSRAGGRQSHDWAFMEFLLAHDFFGALVSTDDFDRRLRGLEPRHTVGYRTGMAGVAVRREPAAALRDAEQARRGGRPASSGVVLSSGLRSAS